MGGVHTEPVYGLPELNLGSLLASPKPPPPPPPLLALVGCNIRWACLLVALPVPVQAHSWVPWRSPGTDS